MTTKTPVVFRKTALVSFRKTATGWEAWVQRHYAQGFFGVPEEPITQARMRYLLRDSSLLAWSNWVENLDKAK